MRTLRPSAVALAVVTVAFLLKTYTEPWVAPRATIALVPGTELWEDFCTPSDYNTFNNDVYLPVATGSQK